MPADRAGKFDAEKVARRFVEAYEGESVETLAVRQMFVAMLKDAFEAGVEASALVVDEAAEREDVTRVRQWDRGDRDASDITADRANALKDVAEEIRLLEKGRGE